MRNEKRLKNLLLCCGGLFVGHWVLRVIPMRGGSWRPEWREIEMGRAMDWRRARADEQEGSVWTRQYDVTMATRVVVVDSERLSDV